MIENRTLTHTVRDDIVCTLGLRRVRDIRVTPAGVGMLDVRLVLRSNTDAEHVAVFHDLIDVELRHLRDTVLWVEFVDDLDAPPAVDIEDLAAELDLY